MLCRAVSGLPPAQWRRVGIHQHTGKWEWGLNNRALSHGHSARYVGRHCLVSALLVSGTPKRGVKTWFRFIAPLSHHTLLDSSICILKKISVCCSCQCCSPYSLYNGTFNVIQLTASLELTSWQRTISAKKNLWMLEFHCKGQEAKSCFLAPADMQWTINYRVEHWGICCHQCLSLFFCYF